MRKFIMASLFLSFALGLISFECNGKEMKMNEEMEAVSLSSPTVTGSSINEFSGEIVNGLREVKVEAMRYIYKPNPIVVKKGEKVRLLITSKDVTHGFKIKEYKINLKLPPNQEKIAEFVADRPGEFIIKCSVFCGMGHMKMGGKLIVQE